MTTGAKRTRQKMNRMRAGRHTFSDHAPGTRCTLCRPLPRQPGEAPVPVTTVSAAQLDVAARRSFLSSLLRLQGQDRQQSFLSSLLRLQGQDRQQSFTLKRGRSKTWRRRV